jgi:hypothetical protein
MFDLRPVDGACGGYGDSGRRISVASQPRRPTPTSDWWRMRHAGQVPRDSAG